MAIPYGTGPQSGSTDPLGVQCPKCGAKPGKACNPHTDAKTGKPVYREPHARRVKSSQQPCEAQKEGNGE